MKICVTWMAENLHPSGNDAGPQTPRHPTAAINETEEPRKLDAQSLSPAPFGFMRRL